MESVATFVSGIFAGAAIAAFALGLLLLSVDDDEDEAERRARAKAHALEQKFRTRRVRDGRLISTPATTDEEAWQRLIERS